MKSCILSGTRKECRQCGCSEPHLPFSEEGHRCTTWGECHTKNEGKVVKVRCVEVRK